jgi:hypothetical protein
MGAQQLHEPKVLTADVLIVGGGTAGCFAAAAAAAAGASVVLLEQDYGLGGAGIRGSIHFYWYGSTGGSQHAIDRAVAKLYTSFGTKPIGFNPDAKRTVLNDVLRQDRIHIVFGAMVYDTLLEGDRVAGVMAAAEEGPIQVNAKVTIDATGDGDIAAAAGVPYQMGREGDGVVHVYSMVPRVVLHDQRIDSINFDSGWVDPTDPWDVSRALMEGRKQIYDIAMQGEWKLHSKTIPFDHLIGISPQIGIRESRLVQGEYRITFEDWVMRRSFDDKIMRCFSHYDNHGIDIGNETLSSQIWKQIMHLSMQKLECDIPYRSIVASEVQGLLLAGRCMSLDRDAAAGIRMQRDMQKVGEAAGVAAALSTRDNRMPSEIDISELQAKLSELGVLKAGELDNEPSYPNIQFEKGELANVQLDLDTASTYLDQIIGYLGQEDQEEQGRALWWISQIGEPAQVKMAAHQASKLSLAPNHAVLYAMSLLRMDQSTAPLIELLERGDANWKQAIILLRNMGTKAAFQEVSAFLAANSYESKDAPLLLQYLGTVADQLSDEEKHYVIDRVRSWLASTQTDKAYTMPRGHRAVSFQWSLEIGAAQLLHKLGDDSSAMQICVEYTKSPHKYIRTAAEKVLERIVDQMVQKEQVL